MPEQDVLRAAAEGVVRASLIPGAYMCDLKSIRAVMLDDDFRRFYGCLLLHEVLPQMHCGNDRKSELAMTLSQSLEMNREATVSALSGCLEGLRDWVVPRLSPSTPCMALGMAMAALLFSGPHDDFDESAASKELFRGLSPDMPADTLVYAVFGRSDWWGKDLKENDELSDLLYQKILDLQLLGVRGAILKACDERNEKDE